MISVYKFGGASVNDAPAIRNVADIIARYRPEQLIVVVSAIGKTTNALEEVFHAWFNHGDYRPALNALAQHHYDIAAGLLEEKAQPLVSELESWFMNLELYLERHTEREDYDMQYDQVISYGELLSSKILSYYLNFAGVQNRWIDIRNFLITDNLYREARVDWELSASLLQKKFPSILKKTPIVTQGFIGGNKENMTTTLGREGSDFTASILAWALDAGEVVIWKDVPGILNADPKRFEANVKFDELNYTDAIEMTYYGARVLHPKTIRPIQNKKIPLHVRSFVHPELEGTYVNAVAPEHTEVPVIILKEKQLLLQLSAKDFSFIAENNIKTIFEAVVECGIKVNIMSNSALSFSMCVDQMEQKVNDFRNRLSSEFDIKETPGLHLLTVSHYQEGMLQKLVKGMELLNEIRNGSTAQFILREKQQA